MITYEMDVHYLTKSKIQNQRESRNKYDHVKLS